MIEIVKPVGSMWSDDQWKAISLSGDHILVAAAAGSGKTAVLVERIIRKIMNEEAGFSVDRLLVATFTKAAAAEMRQRIREALDKELEKEPDNEHLRRQLALLGRASITTLHSFCLEVIRRYYQWIPLDPGFRILNENEAELLRQEILEQIFEEKYGEAEDDGIFLRLADWFSGERSDDALYFLVQKLYDFSRSHSWPDAWLLQMASNFSITDLSVLDGSPWVQSIIKDAKLSLAGAAGLLQQAISIAMLPGGPDPYVDNLRDDLEMVESLRECLEDFPWNALYDAFQTISFSKLKSCRKDETDPDLQNRVKELRDSVKKILNELKNSLFGRSADTFLSELHEVAPIMEQLSEVVILFGQRYQEEKKSRGLVDFSDLEHYCLQILRHPDSSMDQLLPSDAAIEYRDHFDEVLLDEYQDTNSVQEDIVRLIAKDQPGNRFMVGDVKQSIYRFRLADPGLFLDKYVKYNVDMNEGMVIDLARNFRSRRQVLDATNVIFRQIMNETVAEITYNDRAELVYGASFPDSSDGVEELRYTPELLLIDRGKIVRSGEDEVIEGEENTLLEEGELVEMETAQLEARAIAMKVKEMIGETGEPLLIYDKSLQIMRPVAHGDIVILLRSAYIWGPLIMEELRNQGIPADGEQNQGYFQAIEVQVMLSLLQVIDNPLQDIPLASVLRSPIVGLTEEELAQVRLFAKGSFYNAMIAASEHDSNKETGSLDVNDDQKTSEIEIHPELQSKILKFVQKIEGWRNEARRGSLGDLIWNIYRDTGYMDWVGGLPGGGQRQSNLMALYDRAVQYEQTTSSRGLFRFLTFIARLRDHGSDLGSPGRIDKQDNAVRIMTIHKSKGLEFPVVFLAGIGKTFNQQDLNSPFLMHKDLGFGPKFVDQEMRVSYPTLPNLAIRRRSLQELLAEEMRVLYVGLTRPKEKLILIGTAKDLIKKVLSWTQVQSHQQYMLPDYILSKGRSYLDWIGPALIRHPDADNLRQIGGVPELSSPVLNDDPSKWRVSVLSADELSQDLHVDTIGEAGMSQNRELMMQALKNKESIPLWIIEDHGITTEASSAVIENKLDWKYPYAITSTLSAKTSVTEMKKLLSLQETPSYDWMEEKAIRQDSTLQLRRPKFMEKKRLSPTERGTVYHTLMQHIPLQVGVVDSKVVEETLFRLTDLQIVTQEQADIISPQEIVAMFHSEIGRRLLSATWVEREMPFSYALSAADAHHGLSFVKSLSMSNEQESAMISNQLENETVLIQGVVDCIFRENGKLVLVDYKTDRVLDERGGVPALVEQYRFQLELYGKALEDIMGEPISEKWLYFFDGSHWAKL
ncbi:helicase-exonuclease AddAB subunit AddA [Paenibacillus crassostreae]|uniref:ATP-dependent helicase/nuclease subunit A n=1 Tax=Paenibacillus crassostreae TaxID=1763538 RepID=A0A167C2C7_9BACL|nr:helicase-exonuclease AddAB subunit AddA [Paenibacillus crassostreae]AOZ91733.1 helicase-exonuclease AddAB subunit AddA [Paenibacillus crassostreae]OAB72694.1 ATP-dependent helicase [Paenibacillus crassostreae]